MKYPKLNRVFGGEHRKTWIVLFVAVVLGIVAALAARNYFANRMADIEARAKGKMVNVVVAKSDLSRGTKLSSQNVAVRQIPADFAHSVAVTPDQFDRIEGQALAYPIKAGEMVMWGLMEGKRVPTFSARVETGRRAMTVPVDEINSISGMLEPGDIIDLMITLDQKGHKLSVPLLQDVQVMATGTRAVDDPKSGERRSYSTVTLNTTPEQAQYIIVAREAGRLTALLRNPQDKQALTNDKVDLAALLGMKSAAANAGADAERKIPVLYGGGALPAEGLKLPKYMGGGASSPRDSNSALAKSQAEVVRAASAIIAAQAAAASAPANAEAGMKLQ